MLPRDGWTWVTEPAAFVYIVPWSFCVGWIFHSVLVLPNSRRTVDLFSSILMYFASVMTMELIRRSKTAGLRLLRLLFIILFILFLLFRYTRCNY